METGGLGTGGPGGRLRAAGRIGTRRFRRCDPRDRAGRPARLWFTDRAAAAGIDFVHFNGMSGEYYFNEVLGSGGALFDFDNDGDLDVYLLQGQMLGPGRTLDDALFPPAAGSPPADRLYRNDLEVAPDGARTLRFTDVTRDSGLDVASYGMGVAAGDFDNDGWTDLYRTRRGPNQLFRNNGDGTFTDVGAASGADDPLWGVAASFVDADHDGWLDLYVGNYVVYEPGDGDRCRTATDEPSYCAPQSYPYQPDRLYRNRGDGTFADVTAEAGHRQDVRPRPRRGRRGPERGRPRRPLRGQRRRAQPVVDQPGAVALPGRRAARRRRRQRPRGGGSEHGRRHR